MSWAVVVGASDGIGAAFAEELAGRGRGLVLVARRPGPLEEVAGRLREAHGVPIRVLIADAATPEGIRAIAASTEDIDVLVCNAALGPIGPFLDLTPSQVDEMIDLNCRSAAHLARVFGRRMVRRGGGGIILLSSLASNQGSALVAHYAATKAYLRVLAEGLWAELRPHRVHVLACCPGLVDTPTFARTQAISPGRLVPGPMRPRDVARETLAALGRGPVVIPGWRNRLLASVARLVPSRRLVVAASARTATMYGMRSRRTAPAAESGG